MDNIHKVIELAVDGGFKDYTFIEEGWEYRAFCDPIFWFSLGKALRWSETATIGGYGTGDYLGCVPVWEGIWHKFVHHLADGKSADDFFRDLLANHKTS